MSFQTPITIAQAINNIEQNHYLLPAIQREFEWSHSKIEWLFDSIMRNYPISSFLFWRVEGDTRKKYKFYKFLRDYKEVYNTHNEEFPTDNHNDFTAVLDGQQRLTSLLIGLRGSYAYRTPRLREENTERVYPTRHLYLNIEQPLDNEEDGRIYEFKFLKESDVEPHPNKWFKVSKILSLADNFEFNQYLSSNNLKENKFAWRSLSTLQNVIHAKPIINYFLETEQSLDKALNIFIRINSGGEPLSFSDLIMSIAVANWTNRNARKEINSLVDNIRDKGYRITKDFILKTFLFLHSNDIRFRSTNFSTDNAIKFEQEWEKIRDAILSVFDLVRTYGFTDLTLTSKNALIPIIYYLYHKNIYIDYSTKIQFEDDRQAIKKWLHTVLIKRVFGSQADNFLSQIRRAFTSNLSAIPIEVDTPSFPNQRIYENIKMEMGISDEFIDGILSIQKDDMYAFSVLALLYPHLDYKNNNFHKDHLHPKSQFETTSTNAISSAIYNSIINLQMLDANENMSKNDLSLLEWVNTQTNNDNRNKFLEQHLIPDIGLEFKNAEDFLEARKILLAYKLKEVLT